MGDGTVRYSWWKLYSLIRFRGEDLVINHPALVAMTAPSEPIGHQQSLQSLLGEVLQLPVGGLITEAKELPQDTGPKGGHGLPINLHAEDYQLWRGRHRLEVVA